MEVSDFDLTVSIVNWNAGDILLQCVRSVFSTIKRHSFQIFLIDNHSTDNSMQAVIQMFPNVQTICNSHNKGYANAHNQVLSSANSRYVLILNPDAVLTADTVDDMIDSLDNHSTWGLASCDALRQNGSVIQTVTSIPTLLSELSLNIKESFYPFNKIINRFTNNRDTRINSDIPKKVEAIAGPFLLIKMELIRDIGLLDDAFFLFSEELDWCIRSKIRGWKRIYFPDKIIYHDIGTCRKKAPSSFSEYHFYRSRMLLFRKHFGLTKAMSLSAIYSFFGIWMLMIEKSKHLLFILFNKKRDAHICQITKARLNAVFDLLRTGFMVEPINKK